jgi:hypothetical protein
MLVLGLAAATVAEASTGFTAGDVVVYRVGTGSGALSGSATPVFLNEYSPTGTLVESVALPTTTSGPNKSLLASGSATSEGLLTLSANDEYLMLAGYDAALGATEVSETTSTSVPRTIGRVSESEQVNTETALTDYATKNNPRSATSTNGTEIWVGGAAGGVRYTTLGSSTSTELSSSIDKNVREVSIVNGQLYTSADSTKAGLDVATVGSGLPTSGTQTIANLPFASAPKEPYAYSFLTLGLGSAPDTLYVAENETGAVVKYGLSSGKWVAEGSVPVANVTGLTANDSNGTVSIFATSAGSSGTEGKLYEITDSSGVGGTLSGSASLIATAPSDEAFRGVAFAPGTTIGSGGIPTPPPAAPTITPAESDLAAANGDPTNPTIGLTVGDSSYSPSELTVTAQSSDTAVAPTAGLSVSGSGEDRTLTATPAAVGYSTITLTVEAPDGSKATTTVTYGVSANQGNASDRYYAGAGNGSTAIDVGGGYMIVGDDESNVLRLYHERVSGTPVKTFDFTGVLPYGATEMDIEASARSGNTLYWMGSLSNSKKGKLEPGRDVVFAATISGSGANTTLTYLGSYTHLREDLIAWDEANGNPLGFAASTASGVASNLTNGFNVEGLEFASGSTSTAYLAFRAPIEPPNNRADALLVPVTNFSSLVTDGNPGSTKATFGTALQWNLGGLGFREIRKNANNEYLFIAGTSDDSNTTFGLYTWDGNPAHQPVLTRTALSSVAEGAWETIVSVPDPIAEGDQVELLEDNGDTVWYEDGLDSKDGLPAPLQKDLGRVFTLTLAQQSIAWESATPSNATVGVGSYTPLASASSGLPVSFSIDPSTTDNACTLSGSTVSFTGAGTCVIDANQAGDNQYSPASEQQQSFSVNEVATGSGTVEGSVPGTLALSVSGGTSSLGSFTPGVSRVYESSIAATVTTTAAQSTLTAQDPSGVATGHLVNGAFSLAQPLELDATDQGSPTGVLASLGSGPLTLLGFPAPVSNEPVTIGVAQPIGATDPLRTGSYSKTITLTLSTATP